MVEEHQLGIYLSTQKRCYSRLRLIINIHVYTNIFWNGYAKYSIGIMYLNFIKSLEWDFHFMFSKLHLICTEHWLVQEENHFLCKIFICVHFLGINTNLYPYGKAIKRIIDTLMQFDFQSCHVSSIVVASAE